MQEEEEEEEESAFAFWNRKRDEAMSKLGEDAWKTTSGLNGESSLFGVRLAFFDR